MTTTTTPTKWKKRALKTWRPESIQAVTALNTLHDSLRPLSQEDHASRADFKYRTFRRYLQWETEPKDLYLEKLQAYLGIK